MKTLLISLMTVLCSTVLFGSATFDGLDFNSDKFAISWDDITDDLWR